MTDLTQLSKDGSQTQSYYDPSTGRMTEQDVVNADFSRTNTVFNTDGSQTSTVLNANGQKTEEDQVNADGSGTQSFYDPATGNLTRQYVVNSDGSEVDSVYNADGSQTDTMLNSNLQKTEQDQINTDGSGTQSFYDPSTGNLTGENFINPDGSETDYAINADGSQTAGVFDSNGQETQEVQFDPDGSISSITNYANGMATDETWYDKNGMATSETLFDGQGNETESAQLNSDGSVTRDYFDPGSPYETEQDQFNTDGSETQSFYNPSTGNLTGENFVNPDGSETDYAINADGSQTASVLNSAGQETQEVQFDPDGSISSITNYADGTATDKTWYDTDGMATDKAWFDGQGNETEYAQVNGDGSVTYDYFNPDSPYEYERQVYDDNGLAEDYDYNQNTGALTEATGYYDNGVVSSVTDYTNGVPTSETQYNDQGYKTEYAQVNSDGSVTDDLFNPGSPYEYERQIYDDNGLAEDYDYNQNTGALTTSTEYYDNGGVASVTDYTNGMATSEVSFDDQGNETEYAQVNSDGSVTDTLFNPGEQYAYEQNIYGDDGNLAEQYDYNQNTGALTELSDYYDNGVPSSVTDYTNGVATSETLYNDDGYKTEYAQANSDGSATYDYYDPGSPYEYERQIYDGDGLAEEYDYDQDTGVMTESADYYTNGIPSSVTDYTNGAASDETWYSQQGNETQYAQVYGNTVDYYEFNPDAPYSYEQQEYQDGSLVEQNTFDQYSGDIDQAIHLTNGYVSSVTDFSNDMETDQTQYNSSGYATDKMWFDGDGNEIQYAEYDGDETYVDEFSPGSDYASGEQTYVNGQLTEADWYDPVSGELQEVDRYSGGNPYPYEVDFADGGNYFSQIDNVDPQSGLVTGLATYSPTTGALQSYGGDGWSPYGDSDYGYNDSWYNELASLFDDFFGDSCDDYYGGGGYWGGYWGEYGFAGSQATVQNAVNRGIGQIALNDLQQGNSKGATAANTALAQARQAADSTSTPGSGSSVFENAKWDSQVITWSLSGPDGGTADSAEEAAAQKAFATWASASGLTFQEVSDPAQADIHVGWGDLGTPNSGVVGYTTYQAQKGLMTAGGVNITLENPSEDALVTGSDGQLTYSGTDATLEQVMLHEIGHALGLGETSDPSSVMYYALMASNRTLDSTDLTGIQTLYGPGATATMPTTPAANQTTNQLIQAMAAYAPAAPVINPVMNPVSLLKSPLLAASAH